MATDASLIACTSVESILPLLSKLCSIGRIVSGMDVFCLRYAPEDAPTVQIRIGGLLRRDGTPWHERTRDGYFEIVSPDRHLMRRIWTMTKAYVKESLLRDEEPTTWQQAPGLT